MFFLLFSTPPPQNAYFWTCFYYMAIYGGPSRAGPSRAGPSRAEPGRAEPSRAEKTLTTFAPTGKTFAYFCPPVLPVLLPTRASGFAQIIKHGGVLAGWLAVWPAGCLAGWPAGWGGPLRMFGIRFRDLSVYGEPGREINVSFDFICFR